MAKIGRTCKEQMIKELSDTLKGNSNIFVTDCTGLSVLELGKLRNSLKGSKASYVVIKNSIGKLALKNVKADPLLPLIEGTVGLTLAGKDPILTTKALMKFSKDSGKLKVKGGMLDGKLINEKEIKEISLLPSKEVLLARAFGSMKSPISGFVTVLQGTLNKFVYAVNAIKNKKEGENKKEGGSN